MTTETEVEPIALDRHPGKLRVPLEAPVVPMIVATERGDEAVCLEKRLHEWHVLAGVGEDCLRGALAGLCALLSQRHVLVDPGLLAGVYACVLEGQECVDRDVDKGERWD